MIESIQQGDQYGLPVSITVDGKKAIPGQPALGDDTHVHVDGVRVQIGEILKSSEDEDGVTYDGTADTWLYPLTETESRRIGTGRVEVQIAVKINDSYIYAPAETVQVDRSLIREAWDNDS